MEVAGQYFKGYCYENLDMYRLLAICLFRRVDDTLSFNRNWTEYQKGFGLTYESSFWLGLDNLYYLTSQFGDSQLRIDMTNCSGVVKGYGKWEQFKVIYRAAEF